MTAYSKLTALLSSEFNRYLIEHGEVAEMVPKGALVIFQIEGETSFNKWSREMSRRNREKGQMLVYVRVKKWRQRACLEELEVKAG